MCESESVVFHFKRHLPNLIPFFVAWRDAGHDWYADIKHSEAEYSHARAILMIPLLYECLAIY